MPQHHGENKFHSVKHVSEVTREALNQKEPELRRKWRPLWNSGQKLEGRWCFRGYWHGQKIQRIRRQSSFSPFHAVNTVKLWLNPRTFPGGRGRATLFEITFLLLFGGTGTWYLYILVYSMIRSLEDILLKGLIKQAASKILRTKSSRESFCYWWCWWW